MNSDVDADLKVRQATRHSYLQKAKKMVADDIQCEFWSDLAGREHQGIERLLKFYYPLAQI